MLSETPAQNGLPPQVTAAFWCQLAVAGLLVVLAGVNTVATLLFWQLFADASASTFGELLSCAFLLGLAVWLAATAFGLRRRSRAAYVQSLAGLMLPLLLAAACCSGSAGRVARRPAPT